MNKNTKRILSAFTACTIMSSMFAAVHVQAVEDNDTLTHEVMIEDEFSKSYTETCKGTVGDYSFTMWKEPDNGEAEFMPNENGCFECLWSDSEEPEFSIGKTVKACLVNSHSRNYEDITNYYNGLYSYYTYEEGFEYGSKDLTIDYEADISSDGGYFFGGMCKVTAANGNDQTIFIGESYSEMDFVMNRNFIGSITVNEVDYDIYDGAVTVRDFENYDPNAFPHSEAVYWIMRKESIDNKATVKGTVDFNKIITALNNYKNNFAFFRIISNPSLCVRGFGKSGSVKVTKTETNIENYPDEELRNGEKISRGDAVWTLEQNDKTTGKADVASNGDLKYHWANDYEDSHCFIKGSINTVGKYAMDLDTTIYGTGAFSISAEGQKPNKYAFGFCGTIGKPNVEYYVINSYSDPDILKNAEFIEKINTYNGIFSIYKETTDIDTEYGKIVRFFSVSHDNMYSDPYNSQYHLDLKNHIFMWKAYGLTDDTLLELNTFAEISGQSTGNLSLKIPYIYVEGNRPANTYYYEAYNEIFSDYDLSVLQLYLLGEDFLPDNKNYDINDDGVIDVYDLIKLRKLIVREKEGLPWSIDPFVSDDSVVSRETDSFGNWSWGKSYYDKGSIEAVVNEYNLTGQWENSNSAYFSGSAAWGNYYNEDDANYRRYLKYDYTADGSGSFMVGAVISTSDQRKPVLFTNNIYIAESYNDFSYLDNAIASGNASALGTIKTSDGTKYEVIKNSGSIGTEVFLFRSEAKALKYNNTGTIYYDDLLRPLVELVPEIYGKYITVSFGSKCFDESRGYLKCNRIVTEFENFDSNYNY